MDYTASMDLRTDAIKAAFFRCRRRLQQRLLEMHDAWMIREVEELQAYADRDEIKNFFKEIEAIYGPCIKAKRIATAKAKITARTSPALGPTSSMPRPCQHAPVSHYEQSDTHETIPLR
ncbi:unnamed protein product [Schistocephalus solidus]|uniref:Uncharacterized protein n=1 Tax=Schistocephalus solidus TaxID=70667 RepID=A0A183SRE2_SCHSO|nr:unnamed protein product [Schistocephalus solidus]